MIAIIRAFIAQYEVYFGIALCVFSFGSGIYTCHIFHEAVLSRDYQAQIEAHTKAETEANLRSVELEKELAALRKKSTILTPKVKYEIRKADYACVVPESGKLLINQALSDIASR